MRALSWMTPARAALALLHPHSKGAVRAAVDVLREYPHLGRELGGELTGFWRYPVGRLRVIYRFDKEGLVVLLLGPRPSIYEDMAVLVRTRQLSEQRRRYAAGVRGIA